MKKVFWFGRAIIIIGLMVVRFGVWLVFGKAFTAFRYKDWTILGPDCTKDSECEKCGEVKTYAEYYCVPCEANNVVKPTS